MYIILRYLNLKDEIIKLYKNNIVDTIDKVNDVGNDVGTVISQVYSDTENESHLPDHLEQILQRFH